MALINKIRERSGIAVVVIAVALLLFIVGGDIFSGNSKYFGGREVAARLSNARKTTSRFWGRYGKLS